ncbi:MAG: anti-sigma factor domain-containing protein [Mycobacteriales bacterium]
MTTHGRWSELVAGQALDALEPEDEQDCAAHLRGCDVCARSLADMRGLAAQLALAAEPADPPRGVHAAIRAELGATDAPLLVTSRAASTTRGGLRRQADARHLATIVQAAASVVLALALIAWNVTLRGQHEAARRALRRTQAVAAALARADTTTVRLTGSAPAYGSVVVNNERAWLVIDGLERTGPKSWYVLWAVPRAGVVHAITPFEVVNDGVNVIDLEHSTTVRDVTRLVVTREPRHVVPGTPSAHLLEGPVPQPE